MKQRSRKIHVLHICLPLQAISTTSSTSNIQFITGALVNEANISYITGMDLPENPFAAAIKGANSPGAVLELFEEREKAFKGYRE